MWYDDLPPGAPWSGLWSEYTICGNCSGIRRLEGVCGGCGRPSAPLIGSPAEVGGRIVETRIYMGAEGRSEDYVYLRMIEREWKRPVAEAERETGAQFSPRAGIVVLFWTYFETRIERLLRGMWRDAPNALLEDALARYQSVGSRMDRFYRLSCQSTYFADLNQLGFASIAELLAKVQAKRNQFAHGDPEAIDDALVTAVVQNLKLEHESWVAAFNLRASKPRT